MNYKYTSKQKREIRHLVRAECANHFPDDGGGRSMDYCARRDTLCSMINPPSGKICEYFKKCVLPLNSTLEAELLFRDAVRKNCAICGAEFVPASNRQVYCSPKCEAQGNRIKNRERKRKQRGANVTI
ncbi:cysteine-rich VLP protein [Christensenellaceae bacterium NSJ-63]|uniref:Cysteine-rich VLP protein n=1 Tax=Guopingia tenuis TaxID=2763656 RepID=A0A926DEF8_9FIRM|nr:cysteine-rich VLP protein [Guopingia tenuis]